VCVGKSGKVESLKKECVVYFIRIIIHLRIRGPLHSFAEVEHLEPINGALTINKASMMPTFPTLLRFFSIKKSRIQPGITTKPNCRAKVSQFSQKGIVQCENVSPGNVQHKI